MSCETAKRSPPEHWTTYVSRGSSDIGWPFANRAGSKVTKQLGRTREEEVAFGVDLSDRGIEDNAEAQPQWKMRWVKRSRGADG